VWRGVDLYLWWARMLTMLKKNCLRIGVLLGAAGAVLMIAPPVHTREAPESCDKVVIDSAGEYSIKHSKFKGIAPLSHERSGIAIYVMILPPTENALDGEILKLDVEADFRPNPTPDCVVLTHEPTPDAITCVQSIGGLPGLRAQVKFRVNKAGGYDKKMADVLRYLITDVFSCEAPGTHL
jgi:hypothetical protein